MIILNETNKGKIESIIAASQGRAKERTIDVDDIFATAVGIERKLGIPKKHLEGCVFWCDPNAQDFPNAYKYAPHSTQFRLTFYGGKWRVDNICRIETRKNGCGKEVETVTMTAEAKLALINRYMMFSI